MAIASALRTEPQRESVRNERSRVTTPPVATLCAHSQLCESAQQPSREAASHRNACMCCQLAPATWRNTCKADCKALAPSSTVCAGAWPEVHAPRAARRSLSCERAASMAAAPLHLANSL